MSGPIAIVEAIATLFWVHAGLGFLEWLARVARTERRAHVPHAVDLLANLVPAMIALVVVVLAGAFIGLPSVVVIIAILFPAGLAFGLHQTLNDLRETSWRAELSRLFLVALIAGGVIWVRQFA